MKRELNLLSCDINNGWNLTQKEDIKQIKQSINNFATKFNVDSEKVAKRVYKIISNELNQLPSNSRDGQASRLMCKIALINLKQIYSDLK